MPRQCVVAFALVATLGCATGNDSPVVGGSSEQAGGAPNDGGSPAVGGEAAGGEAPGSGGAGELVHGVLVVTEIMVNPDATSDSFAEWFEVWNAASFPIPLAGLVVREDVSDTVAVVTLDTADVLAPGAYYVLGKSTDTSVNGGVAVQYLLPASLSLTNTGDYLSLETSSGLILDSTQWGEAPQGASLSLDPEFMDASSNDDDSHYCAAVTLLASGDTGTPGASNDACP